MSRPPALAERLVKQLGLPAFTAGKPASAVIPGCFWLVTPRRGKRGLGHAVTLNAGVPPRRELKGLPWALIRTDCPEPLRWVGRTDRRGGFTVRGPEEGVYAVRYVAAVADEQDRAILTRLAERHEEAGLHRQLRGLLRSMRVDAPVGDFAARPLVGLLEQARPPHPAGRLAFYERAAGAVERLLRTKARPDRAGTTLAGETQTRLDGELRPLNAPEEELLAAGTDMARVYRLSRLAGRTEAEIAGLLGTDEPAVSRLLTYAQAWAKQ